MHILFLTDNFPPEVNAPASRTFEHCKEWVKAGHQVTVITCAPNFPGGKLLNGYKNNLWQSEEMEGIRVIRVWSYITSNSGFLKRILDYMSYMLMSFLASFFVRKVDIVIGTSPQFFTCCSAWAVSLFKWKPFVFELRDLWPESIKTVGAMKQGLMIRVLEYIEVFLYRRASLIVSVTNSFKENLIARGINDEKIKVVTNGVDISRFSPMPKDISFVQKHEFQNKFVAGYIGTHGMAHALGTLVEVAKELEGEGRDDIVILLLGDGAEKQKIKELKNDLNANQVILIDSVPKEEVAKYWSLLDVSIVHLKKDPLFKTVIPSKIFEAFGMGIPIIMGVQGEAAEIVKDANAGVCVEPENVGEIKNAILELCNNAGLYDVLKGNGPIAAKNYERSKLAHDMLSHLMKLKK